ncbi:MFS transporter [Streptomyces sp. B6B3]|uniref:MFS transporter n=1 Tax=Streptomyces sp. B6B3 TaxID=3153570 RepID=UPI00325CF71B
MNHRAAAAAEPLRDGRFRRLLLAMAVSSVGTSGTRIALAWLVVVDLGAGDRFGLVLAAYGVPQFVVGLVGAALADRHGPRALCRAGFVAAGLTLLAMWLLGRAGALSVGAVAALVVVTGASLALSQPLLGAILVSLVDADRLGPANMLRVVVVDTAAVLGPTAASLVIAAWHAPAWFLLDALTFLVAAALLPAPRARPAAGTPARSGARPGVRRAIADAVAGLRYVARRFGLWSGIAAAGLGNLLVTVPLLVCVPLLVDRERLGSGTLGIFFALFTAGCVLGAAEAGLVRRTRPVRAGLVCLLFAGLGTSLVGVWSDRVGLFCLAVAIGCCVADFDVRWSARLQGAVPPDLLARVLAGDAWFSFVCRTAGMSTLGLLAFHHTGALLAVCGLTMAALAGALALSPGATGAAADGASGTEFRDGARDEGPHEGVRR